MVKDAKDKALLREYALICRVLMIFMCFAYIITVIVLGIALGAKSAEDHTNDSAGGQFELESKAHFYIICISSLVALLLCTVFIMATFIGNLWMTVPYFILHVLLIVYSVILVVVEIQSIYRRFHKKMDEDRATSFGRHVVFHKGAGPIFCGILAIHLLVFTLFPIVKFMNECRLRRRERIMEERQKQKKTEFQFAFADDKAESERPEMDSGTGTSTPTSAPSRRTSSVIVLTRENSVTPAERERVKKSIHGHRKHYY